MFSLFIIFYIIVLYDYIYLSYDKLIIELLRQ
ncbi:hypothetical protein Xszus_01445 [Xenorhabdus szentirmaii]|nr:hypothetical protein Xsze_02585 [Xenorhabdus szentirmaii DSM 16338]PHM41742.1 hypothetical protein Xszus_01445 [Xenorhabdus szentirmaii]